MSYEPFNPVEPDHTGLAHDGTGRAFSVGMVDNVWYDACVLQAGRALMKRIGPVSQDYEIELLR